MSYKSDEDIESKAEAFRQALNLSKQYIPDLMTVIFKAKKLGIIKEYLRIPKDNMPDDEAAYDPKIRVLSIREDTLSGINNSYPRPRFTVAHEFGHVLLAHRKTRHRNSTGRAIDNAPLAKIDELQANKFAGSFLVPLVLIETGWTRQVIARKFGVSQTVSQIRLDVFNRNYRIENNIRRELPASVVNFLMDAESRGYKLKHSQGLLTALIREARLKGYVGDACAECGNFTMVRNGTCLKCDTCGGTSGCS